MTQEQLLNLFLSKGLEARMKKREVQVRTCPKCGNAKWNFEANVEENLYHCWACNAGKGDDLQSFLFREYNVSVTLSRTGRRKHVEYIQPQQKESVVLGPVPESVLPFLRSRGLERDVGPYRLTFCSAPERFKDGERNPLFLRLLFPLTEYWSFQTAGEIARTVVGYYPKYYYTGSQNVIAGYRHRSSKVHVVCEGVIDGIKIHKAGFNAAVLLGKQNDTLKEWAARVPREQLIIIALDGDAYEDAVRLMWEIIPIHSMTTIMKLPPHLDPGSLLPEVLGAMLTRLQKEATC